ncbi:hypothetical protein [Pedobacter psychroterrae]|uniref:Uncharacterized protein n=1 Tax=Pedobacter psychroterrae TaxID=2530453 RepID=A0A4R0NSR1_9SPHI|nr:hypothetical protein [Pedobacter psychroterrae]TCD03138.1 hypothetical protein EZ437_03955 [Pedobacter psychroterrae]
MRTPSRIKNAANLALIVPNGVAISNPDVIIPQEADLFRETRNTPKPISIPHLTHFLSFDSHQLVLEFHK